jgi:hypothetical protein
VREISARRERISSTIVAASAIFMLMPRIDSSVQCRRSSSVTPTDKRNLP